MKYSLRSLMIMVLVLPPLLAWGSAPIYRWLTTPKPARLLNIAKPITTPPSPPLSPAEMERLMGELERDVQRGPREMTIPIEDRDKQFQKVVDWTDQLNSRAPAPNPPKK